MNLERFIEQFSQALADGSLFSLVIALLAGIVACGVCPCTLPVGLGIAGLVSTNTEKKSNKGLFIAFTFFLGIVACLAIMGALAGRLGIFLTENFGRYWAISMALISAIAAVIAFYGPRLKINQLTSLRKPGFAGTFIYGFIFGFGTSAAPLLLLLSVVAARGNALFGFLLALSFGVGRGLPFLLVGGFANVVTKFVQLTWFRKSIQIGSGLALLFVSIYYFRVYLNLL